MDFQELKLSLSEMEARLQDIKDNILLIDNKKTRLNEIDSELSKEEVWSDLELSQKLSKEKTTLEKSIKSFDDVSRKLSDSVVLLEVSIEENDDSSIEDILNERNEIVSALEELEFSKMFGNKMDPSSAFVEIQSGSGGTEAQDWAEMLLRMYTRHLSSNNIDHQIEEMSQGEEAGIKSASIRINGFRAYANLESERGVHRLVRISPFDSNKRRHTSFAGVDVIPLIENNDEINIQDDEIRIDVYRSSGAGGQHVNTTDSAVRITHIATGIVVACQAERSQLQNKTRALELLKTKLLLKKREDELKKLNEIRGDQHEAGWGRQIRSYVLQPYQQVKDARNSVEVGNVQNVLDGDISIFIKEYLKWRRQGIND